MSVKLRVMHGANAGKEIKIPKEQFVIGRGEDCAVMLLGDGSVSRRHALIRSDGRQVTVEDAGSTHGTYLGGRRIGAAVPIQRGDVIQVGQTLLRFD